MFKRQQLIGPINKCLKRKTFFTKISLKFPLTIYLLPQKGATTIYLLPQKGATFNNIIKSQDLVSVWIQLKVKFAFCVLLFFSCTVSALGGQEYCSHTVEYCSYTVWHCSQLKKY